MLSDDVTAGLLCDVILSGDVATGNLLLGKEDGDDLSSFCVAVLTVSLGGTENFALFNTNFRLVVDGVGVASQSYSSSDDDDDEEEVDDESSLHGSSSPHESLLSSDESNDSDDDPNDDDIL